MFLDQLGNSLLDKYNPQCPPQSIENQILIVNSDTFEESVQTENDLFWKKVKIISLVVLIVIALTVTIVLPIVLTQSHH